MATVTPYKRELPFIHRAWKTAVDHLPYSMGIKLSTANGDTPTNGDHSPRAAKRRRIIEESPEAARAMPGRLLSENPDDVERALRIEVLSITRMDNSGPRPSNLHYGNGSPEKKDIPVIKARCRVLICEWSPPDVCRVLHSDSQICNFKVFRDSDDICRTARIYLPSPFQIPAGNLFIERGDEKGFDLGDEYLIRVEIESAGDPKWPPMDLLPRRQSNDVDSGNPRRWILSSQVIYGFEKGRASGTVKIRKRTKEDIPLDLAMDMDLRWSTSHTAASMARIGDSVPPPDAKVNHTNGVLEPLTNGHVNGRMDNGLHDYRKSEIDRVGVAEDDEDHEEATTPSRSLRTREKQNYNLKLLSDKARGKERKERKQRKLANLEKKGSSVTWAVPLIGEFMLDNYHCIRCFATHSSMDQLAVHFKAHTDIKYSIDLDRAFIRIIPLDEDALRPLNSTFLSLSSPDDHETDQEGDLSPQRQPRKLSQQRNRPPQSSWAKRGDSRQLIPNIKQPIYDRLSKSLLEPGSLVDPPPVDDAWLVQKHRDIIRDYSDVHQDEKEYIFEWDAFVNRDCVTSEPHLQDVYIRFVQDKASWIVASQNRITEWSKHLAYLKSRNALADATITEALAIMRQFRSQRRPEQPDVIKAPSPRAAYRKSVAGCAVCGQPVRGPASLICSNLTCSKALYHVECIRQEAKQPVESRSWRCNNCCDEQKAIG
ncbi:hypothetical protein F5Y19DRAFT_413337 [Xylariaceae sp. FL1651]|nr:hypothetical protein F5Y19DRAFT_413337 [Xylariaceae sp. FL1651]